MGTSTKTSGLVPPQGVCSLYLSTSIRSKMEDNKVFTNHTFVTKKWINLVWRGVVWIYSMVFLALFVVSGLLWFLSLGHVQLWVAWFPHWEKTVNYCVVGRYERL